MIGAESNLEPRRARALSVTSQPSSKPALHVGGRSFGSVGRLMMLFAADNTLIDVVQDVGNVQADYEAICEALASESAG